MDVQNSKVNLNYKKKVMKKLVLFIVLFSPLLMRSQSFSYSFGVYSMSKFFSTQNMLLPTISTTYNFKKSGVELSFSYLFFTETTVEYPSCFSDIDLLYFLKQKVFSKDRFLINIRESLGLTHYFQIYYGGTRRDSLGNPFGIYRGTYGYRGIIGLGTEFEYKLKDRISIIANSQILSGIVFSDFFAKYNYRFNFLMGVKYSF